MPTKAAYKALDEPEIWFDYFLARELGMTVDRLRSEMPHAEYVTWGIFYARKQQNEELAHRTQGG